MGSLGLPRKPTLHSTLCPGVRSALAGNSGLPKQQANVLFKAKEDTERGQRRRIRRVKANTSEQKLKMSVC